MTDELLREVLGAAEGESTLDAAKRVRLLANAMIERQDAYEEFLREMDEVQHCAIELAFALRTFVVLDDALMERRNLALDRWERFLTGIVTSREDEGEADLPEPPVGDKIL